MRPDCELCVTPMEIMSPEEKERYITKPESYWMDQVDRGAMMDRIAQLEAQVRYLRGYVISKACEVYVLKDGHPPTEKQIRYIIGGIDGNVAVAGARAEKETTT